MQRDRRRPPGCRATCSRICSQRRIAAATGVGPNTAADARQPRISNSSRSSPARPRVRRGALPRLVGPRRQALDPVDPGPQPPRPALAEVVAVALEVRERRIRDLRAPARGRRSSRRAGARAAGRPARATRVACRARARRARSPPRGTRRRPRAGRPRRAPRRARTGARGDRDRPPRAATRRARAGRRRRRRRRARSAARAAVASRSAASAASARSCSPAAPISTPEPDRLLEVVADDLVRDALPALQPAGEALVQVGAQPLRQAEVRDLADQRMREAEGVLAGELGPVGADRAACARDPSATRRWRAASPPTCSSATAPRWKRAALDGGVREHGSLVRLEALDSRGEHGLDRVRQPRRGPAPRARRRAARGTAGCPRPSRRSAAQHRGSSSPAASVSTSARASARRTAASSSSSEPEGCERRPRRPGLEQLRAREADQQDRRSAGEGDDGTRAGRAASARPSGCRRSRPPAAAPAPPPRAAGGPPRRSRPPAPTRRRGRSRRARGG